jgi:hypothetical protein
MSSTSGRSLSLARLAGLAKAALFMMCGEAYVGEREGGWSANGVIAAMQRMLALPTEISYK